MEINGEVCKPIEGFARYVISENGRIYRVKALNSKETQFLIDNPERNYVRESKIQFYEGRNRGRWTQVGLVNDKGKFATKAAEKLLCKSFELYNNKNKNYAVSFKDGNKKNMHISNIELDPWKPNNAKLTLEDVKLIKKQIAEGKALYQIAKSFGVSDMQISRIKSGENWRRGGRINPIPKAPFKIEDGKMRRFLSTFEFSEIDEKIRRPFTIKRSDNSSENKIIGVVNGYRLAKSHKNISRARALVFKLNQYFFNEDIAIKTNNKLQEKVDKQPEVI
jgi:hypothetical protein